jgi:hypothetical protein
MSDQTRFFQLVYVCVCVTLTDKEKACLFKINLKR